MKKKKKNKTYITVNLQQHSPVVIITEADNGFQVDYHSFDGEEVFSSKTVHEYKGEVDTDGLPKESKVEVETAREMLSEVAEILGVNGSRHSKHRLYIIDRPGDKHNDFTDMDSEVIWGNPQNVIATISNVDEKEEDDVLSEIDEKSKKE
jgi:hypothetical protein